ncbi:hypothetical protein [Niveispirillum sp.]|uniref:hypothetical protein n=1 Tax=Niveispirillum sp. TaxID=1917217 RepID=UPI001B77747D|nr:hypothetical protein [Niveispirillum sp.]MBP7337785.1 hypothetical protein [Niveispirillum sp.]
MTDESQVQARAFQLWDGKGRQPGLLNICLEQARRELAEEARLDHLSADKATAPPASQTRPGQLFRDPKEDQPAIDRRGRTIETDDSPSLMRTETQGVPQD